MIKEYVGPTKGPQVTLHPSSRWSTGVAGCTRLSSSSHQRLDSNSHGQRLRAMSEERNSIGQHLEQSSPQSRSGGRAVASVRTASYEMTDTDRLLPLRPVDCDRRGRSGAHFGLPLPRLPEAHRQHLFGAGALAGRMRDDRGPSSIGQAPRTADSRRPTISAPTADPTVYYGGGNFPDLVAIPLGAFDDPLFRVPRLFRVGAAQARLGRHSRRRHRALRLISRPTRRDRRAGNCRPSAFRAAPGSSRASAGPRRSRR